MSQKSSFGYFEYLSVLSVLLLISLTLFLSSQMTHLMLVLILTDGGYTVLHTSSQKCEVHGRVQSDYLNSLLHELGPESFMLSRKRFLMINRKETVTNNDAIFINNKAGQ